MTNHLNLGWAKDSSLTSGTFWYWYIFKAAIFFVFDSSACVEMFDCLRHGVDTCRGRRLMEFLPR